jgi:hypothetical protein
MKKHLAAILVFAFISIKIEAQPCPAINFSQSNSVICLGKSASFTATGAGSYAWAPSSNLNTGTGAVVVASPTAAGITIYTVTATTGTCVATNTISLTTNATPVLSFNATSACDMAPICITNTSSSQVPVTTWFWDFGDGIGTSSVENPNCYTYATPGIYTIVLTATASTGCSARVTLQDTVHPNPIVYFNAFEACFGTPSEFINNSLVESPVSISDSINLLQWDYGDGSANTFNTNSEPDTLKHTYAACGAYNITLTVTTVYGCTDHAMLIGDTVFCLPVVIAPASFTVCPGTFVPPGTFTTTVANGGPPACYWMAFSTSTGIPQTDYINGGEDVVPSYQSIYKNMFCENLGDTIAGIAVSAVGCIGNLVYYTVSVYPTPYLQHLTDSVCANQTATIPNFSSCPIGSIINWTNSNSSTGLAVSGTGNIGPFTAYNTSSTVNNVSVVNATPTDNGCIGNDSTFIIAVKPLPDITSTYSANYLCLGNTTTLTASGATSYTWSANANNATTNTVSVSPNTNAVYTLTASGNGCVTTNTVLIAVVNTLPAAGFMYGLSSCCNYAGFTDTSRAVTGDPIVAWNWTFANGSPSTSTNQNPGDYLVFGYDTVCLTVTTLHGCKDSTCEIVHETIAGINKVSDVSGIAMYPNPATNNLQITSSRNENIQIQIMDVLGNEAMQTGLQNGKNIIDVSNLQSGVYFIKSSMGTQKFIKQ